MRTVVRLKTDCSPAARPQFTLNLEGADIRQALAFAAWSTSEKVLDVA
jgi:hypothetical protein